MSTRCRLKALKVAAKNKRTQWTKKVKSHVDKENKSSRKIESVGENGARNRGTRKREHENERNRNETAWIGLTTRPGDQTWPRYLACVVCWAGGVVLYYAATTPFRHRATQ
ncbi:hypothetical protein QVD17_30420 [Tagetes erecta]|uniref:Transmembrane protein n=1 Tax=Tagetes erecta TaxID=13708 RepID=A0AAD8K7X6_TARER|nr:hypothetical protein QVD17_30420 [Tagetes erecta]